MLMKRFGFLTAITLLCVISIFPLQRLGNVNPAYAQAPVLPMIGLRPDVGFPLWLTDNPENFLPLITSQTSGLDWVASDMDENGLARQWLICADDVPEGGIHIFNVSEPDGIPQIEFVQTDLTLPPPAVAGFSISPENGYDWEAIALHPWSGTAFLSQEGTGNEIAIYCGSINPGAVSPGSNALGRNGDIDSLPGYFSNMHILNLPGWNEVFGSLVQNNIGIEGMACSEDRLFLGLESPYSFPERLISEKSTVLAIWKINPADPSDMESCELLKVHDTSDWSDQLGFTIETICGLDAIDSTHIVGIDRDNQRMFAVEFSETGEYVGGRIFYLDTPGPAPLESDACPPLDHLPRLLKPTLESVAVVPSSLSTDSALTGSYYVYLTVDPWAQGWAPYEPDWNCPSYEDRLNSLLPALYRYTINSNTLFPEL
jgi:hypothetical protein